MLEDSGAPLRYCQDPGELADAMGLEFQYVIREIDAKASQWTGYQAAAGESGTWGADAAQPTCVYSPKGHTSPYYITVADRGNNCWSWTCCYRFRVRVVDNSCTPPCQVTAGNCGT